MPNTVSFLLRADERFFDCKAVGECLVPAGRLKQVVWLAETQDLAK